MKGRGGRRREREREKRTAREGEKKRKTSCLRVDKMMMKKLLLLLPSEEKESVRVRRSIIICSPPVRTKDAHSFVSHEYGGITTNHVGHFSSSCYVNLSAH